MDLILDMWVLQMAYTAHKHRYGEADENEVYTSKFISAKGITFLTSRLCWGWLGRHIIIRVVLPSCACSIAAIRNKFPSSLHAGLLTQPVLRVLLLRQFKSYVFVNVATNV